MTKDSTVELFSASRIAIVARLVVVCFAVLVLYIPVILFLLTSMSRACMSVVVLTFVLVFSSIMSLLTDAGIQEIFVGTATYCAVLVTFLGNLQSSKTWSSVIQPAFFYYTFIYFLRIDGRGFHSFMSFMTCGLRSCLFRGGYGSGLMLLPSSLLLWYIWPLSPQ